MKALKQSIGITRSTSLIPLALGLLLLLLPRRGE